MKHYFIFDGVDSRDFLTDICEQNAYDAPAREYTRIDIPGRNGQLLIDEGRYSNVAMGYSVIMVDHFRQHIDRLRNALLTRVGYKRLEDTYHPDEFYQAGYTGGFEVTTTPHTTVGRFVLSFERKPQRWLKSGENTHTCEDSLVLVNPELTNAKPLIRVYGTGGSFYVNGQAITIGFPTGIDPGYIDIDSETENVYKGNDYYNGPVVFAGYKFPELKPGENQIIIDRSGGSPTQYLPKIEIIPRWYRL